MNFLFGFALTFQGPKALLLVSGEWIFCQEDLLDSTFTLTDTSRLGCQAGGGIFVHHQMSEKILGIFVGMKGLGGNKEKMIKGVKVEAL